ncbi:unnamed protein product [Adineta steineri]|uniref:Endonuclease/exonuclease/phosphatase domain-containing protein n=1 Tax=Adineta steineri TaxID=433720 RepID=A0A818XYU0_9BILA|nr:unnamed protein product [Adineta steineri]
MPLYHIDLNNIQRKATLDCYQNLVIPTIQCRDNLTMFTLDIDDDLCSCIRILDQIKLENVTSLKIKNLNKDNAIYLLSLLPSLTQLVFLRIQSKVDLDLNQFLQFITMPSLKQFELLFLNYYYPSYSTIVPPNIVSNIEYLCVYRYFRIQQFKELLRYLPKLKKLFIYIRSHVYSTSIDNNDNLHQLVPNLNDLQLYVQLLEFDQLQLLLRPLSHQLKRLAISCWSYEYTDGQKWEIFLKSFSALKHFQLDITLSELPVHPINIKEILSSFQTKFFLDARWYFAIDYNPNVEIKFVLYSLPWPIKYFHTILYDIETLSTKITIPDQSYSTSNVRHLYIQLYDQISNAITEQRYYSNAESLILINRFSDHSNERSLQMINDLSHTIDLTRIKSLKLTDFDSLQPSFLIPFMNYFHNLFELKLPCNIYLQHQSLISTISTIHTLVLYYDSNDITKDELWTATINVHSFRKPENRQSNIDELVSILKPLNLHCIAVEEIQNNDKWKKFSQDMSLPYSIYGPWNGNAAGNGILSCYPIQSYSNQQSSLICQGGTRSFLQCSIDDFTCAVTHLDHMEEDVRLEQIKEFKPYNPDMDILMGDMNSLTRDDYSDNYYERIIVNKREKSNWEKPRFDLTHLITQQWNYQDAFKLINPQIKDEQLSTCAYGTRIDYIYVHPRINERWNLTKCSIIDTKGVTDHNCVFAEFTKHSSN